MRYILIWLLAVPIAACTPSKLEKTALTPSERALVRGAVDDVARGDSTSLSNKVPPELAAKLAPVLGKMREQLPASPLELSFLNANWTLSGGGRSTDAVYSVKGKSGWALVEANTQTSNGRTMLTAIYIQRTPADPEKVNSFSLREARPAGVGDVGRDGRRARHNDCWNLPRLAFRSIPSSMALDDWSRDRSDGPAHELDNRRVQFSANLFSAL